MRGGWLIVAIVVVAVLGLQVGHAHAEGDIDVSGEWQIELDGTFGASCTVGAVQRGDELFFAGGCTLIIPLVLEGEIDRATGEFSVQDRLGITATGMAAKDGDSVSGAWAALGLSGTFTGTRVDRRPHFVDVSGRWNLELGPTGQQTGSEEPFDTCTLEIRQLVAQLTASLDCETLGARSLRGPIDPVAGEFFLLPDGEAGSLITELHGVMTEPGSIAGLYYVGAGGLSGPFEGTRTGGPLGDADCDGEINSIDASIVLQFDAGLIASVECADSADVNGEGSANSVDAVLILQHEAGLIVNLAVGW
ncbi:MAG: hypothetical protein A2148_09090 [Chloroflexi bacterium RBG_16_68_14]|nr:MAG: hypothetical protein A2148_09090 [Chloroflexi bacterium RBG_16_68_14]